MEFTFNGVLSKIATVTHDDEPVKSLSIKLVTNEPNVVSEAFDMIDLTRIFRDPIQWDKVSFSIGRRVDLKFDQLTFSTMLKTVNVKRKETDDGNSMEFTFGLEKALDPQVDHILSANYLKHKEPDPDTGKPKLVTFEVEMKC